MEGIQLAATVSGGKKAAETNRERHGKDFYKRIGKSGGLVKGTKGGFASPCMCSAFPEKHVKGRCSGVKGGRISRRGENKPKKHPLLKSFEELESKLATELVSLGVNLKEVGERYLENAKNTKVQ